MTHLHYDTKVTSFNQDVRSVLGNWLTDHNYERLTEIFIKHTAPPPVEKVFTIDEIMLYVSARTGISIADIKSYDRHREVTEARHSYCYICRRLTRASLKVIGDSIGRDHTTVVAAQQNMQNLIDTDERVKNLIEGMVNGLKR